MKNIAVSRKRAYLCSVLIQQLIVLHLKIIQTKMKKLVFMFAAFAAISFASCGSKTEAPVEANDSDTVALDTCDTVCDTVVTDTVAA